MFDDTSLMRMVIEDISKRQNWSYEDTIDRFYHSNTCRNISNKETGLFTYAPWEIVAMFEEEIAGS